MQAIAALSVLLVALSSLTVSASHLRKRHLQVEDKYLGDARIVGGVDAYQGQFPFYGRWGGCGASLISSEFMLTAAHCNPQKGNRIRLSAHNFYNDGLNVTIMKRFPHPNKTEDELYWDYLLLQLEEPVVNVTPVTLNSEASIPGLDDILTVIGLGWLSYEPGSTPENLPDYLQVVNVPVSSHEYCAQAYEGIDDNTMLCAGDSQYDSCVGDSGGPLLTSTGEQVGVVSFGEGCAKAGKPGVYARVSYVISWIRETVCFNSVEPPSFCDPSLATLNPFSLDPTPSPT